MKTRNQAKRKRQPYGQDDTNKEAGDDPKANGTLANITPQKGINKFQKRVASRGLKGKDINFDSASKLESLSKGKEKQVKVNIGSQNIPKAELENSAPLNTDDGKSSMQVKSESEDVMADSDWEDGPNSNLNSEIDHQNHISNNISIEIDASPGDNTAKRKPVRRASAEEKEVAELVHRTHLLCLLARGRVIDSACNDPLIQASLLSLLPTKFLKLSEATNLTVDALTPLVNWFHSSFRVRSSSSDKSFHSALATALGTQEGTPEEVAALSVAMFRSLNLLTRFVSILDAASLKPDADKSDDMSPRRKTGTGVFQSSTIMVTRSNEPSTSSNKQFPPLDVDHIASIHNKQTPETSSKPSCQSQSQSQTISPVDDQSNERRVDLGSKRKGDLEFEMQMQMALSATATKTSEISNTDSFKKLKKIKCEEDPSSSSSSSISTAIGSRKVGAPLYWAEVYLNGKWVHVDTINATIDGENKVEALVAACKTSLRYVVAFNGQGAKDVTRRYCAKWYKIASHRVNSTWWDAVLAPLKDLESKTTQGIGLSDNLRNERASLEDMELETKALTEPLPTNQQAYRSHHLYAIERWLTKYQILHPKGPILGFCSGHPVYPRASVQILHTKEKWLREGLQLKVNELPVKVLERSVKVNKGKVTDEDDCVGPTGTIHLYGKWQTEPLCLPHAQNGIVPKNERGQVDVWSEKCLPPGTVHLGFPRIFNIAKKLNVDYAPAMVGFEFKNGRSYPLYNGIVVCSEFKDMILDAYGEEEERRGEEERRKSEAKALSRWYQLLSSIVTRQRLNNRYAKPEEVSSCHKNDVGKTNDSFDHCSTSVNTQDVQKLVSLQENDDVAQTFEDDHEHVFVNGSLDVENSVRKKSCRCGFSIEVEEM
ncbi:DNA repair protein RAD4 [Lactuca sativa]|uniref:Rad4 beta-hairpin domain-containing protein n=1 Tax=Lactuca sativa TaxID=4236 RepID=A0A9R1WGB9_LACSA|nr:DNA repair protein RAD4 [Lactuca sativa]KAJ0221936.1 hypothetical protein LSAT_V11C200075030 [Lactuca sativa]